MNVCVECGTSIPDDETWWRNVEPARHSLETPGGAYPGYRGDPVCGECVGVFA